MEILSPPYRLALAARFGRPVACLGILPLPDSSLLKQAGNGPAACGYGTCELSAESPAREDWSTLFPNCLHFEQHSVIAFWATVAQCHILVALLTRRRSAYIGHLYSHLDLGRRLPG